MMMDCLFSSFIKRKWKNYRGSWWNGIKLDKWAVESRWGGVGNNCHY